MEKLIYLTLHGLFEPNYIPIGMVTASVYFQQVYEYILRDLLWKSCVAFIDNVYVKLTWDMDKHCKALRKVLTQYHEHNMKLRPSKCHFGYRTLEVLGHMCTPEGRKPVADKVEAINKMLAPENMHEVRRFVGMTGYYCRYIMGYTGRAKPLTKLTKKNTVWRWKERQKVAFAGLKNALIQAPLLRHPDNTKPFIADADTSKHTVGRVMGQLNKQEGKHPVVYHSCSLIPAEKNYSITEKKGLAVMDLITKHRSMIFGTLKLII